MRASWIKNYQMKNTNTRSVCYQNPGVLGVWPISTPALFSHPASVSQTQPSRNAAPTATQLAQPQVLRARVTGTDPQCARLSQCVCARTCMMTAANASHFIPSLSQRLALPCYWGAIGKGCDAIHIFFGPRDAPEPLETAAAYLCIP